MRIALVYNERPSDLERSDPLLERFIEGDEWKTIEAISNAIASHGHQVAYFAMDNNIYERLKAAKDTLDLLFNFSEGTSRGADREAQLPMLAEILGIPYTGPGPLSAALILNKARAKEIWMAHAVPTAPWQLFTTSTTSLSPQLSYPLLVKPNGEGSGIGIKNNSIVHTLPELRTVVTDILTNYHQNALVEAYLPGREFTLGLIGNDKDLITLPIVEINFASFPQGVPQVDTYAAKFIYGAEGIVPMEETEFCPAKVSKSLEKTLIKAARDAYQTIGCRDFGRVDLRLDDKGHVYVLEINHPPGLMSDPHESSFFTIAGRALGLDFNALVGRILSAATTRLAL